MSFHNQLSGNDLHAPSTQRIINGTGSELLPGQFVFLGATSDSDGFVTVTRLATANEKRIGIVVTSSIGTVAEGAKGVVLVLGRFKTDTSSFSNLDPLRLNSSNTFALATDTAHTIGYVLNSAVDGEILLDTFVAPPIITGVNSLEQLSDTNISNPQSGQVIKFRSGKWDNENNTIVDLSDTDIDANPTNGDVLIYNSNENKWVSDTNYSPKLLFRPSTSTTSDPQPEGMVNLPLTTVGGGRNYTVENANPPGSFATLSSGVYIISGTYHVIGEITGGTGLNTQIALEIVANDGTPVEIITTNSHVLVAGAGGFSYQPTNNGTSIQNEVITDYVAVVQEESQLRFRVVFFDGSSVVNTAFFVFNNVDHSYLTIEKIL